MNDPKIEEESPANEDELKAAQEFEEYWEAYTKAVEDGSIEPEPPYAGVCHHLDD